MSSLDFEWQIWRHSTTQKDRFGTVGRVEREAAPALGLWHNHEDDELIRITWLQKPCRIDPYAETACGQSIGGLGQVQKTLSTACLSAFEDADNLAGLVENASTRHSELAHEAGVTVVLTPIGYAVGAKLLKKGAGRGLGRLYVGHGLCARMADQDYGVTDYQHFVCEGAAGRCGNRVTGHFHNIGLGVRFESSPLDGKESVVQTVRASLFQHLDHFRLRCGAQFCASTPCRSTGRVLHIVLVAEARWGCLLVALVEHENLDVTTQ